MTFEPKTLSFGNQTDWPEEVIIHTDGASKGNPGPASLGLTVSDLSDAVVFEYAESLGHQTNNFAEYTAVIRAFEFCVKNNVKKVILKSDSQLLIRQLNGQYKVKSAVIIPLFQKSKVLLSQISKNELVHVRREFNVRADELANQVLL
ncbi:MAG: ribonuclease HI family protein [Bdellovibrionaceae bacterium]|jgi:ribonuclease HI|nr:ribonuclease HI family protein [Pseudobdellovibrionaceae bacterium]